MDQDFFTYIKNDAEKDIKEYLINTSEISPVLTDEVIDFILPTVKEKKLRKAVSRKIGDMVKKGILKRLSPRYIYLTPPEPLDITPINGKEATCFGVNFEAP